MFVLNDIDQPSVFAGFSTDFFIDKAADYLKGRPAEPITVTTPHPKMYGPRRGERMRDCGWYLTPGGKPCKSGACCVKCGRDMYA